MRVASILIPVVLVLGLLGLTMLPTGYAQPLVGQTAQYLPAVFKAPPTPTPLPMLTNGDFEQGSVGWLQSGGAIISNRASWAAHGGHYYGWFSSLDGRNQIISQDHISVPRDRPILSFWSNATVLAEVCRGHNAGVMVNHAEFVLLFDLCNPKSTGVYQRKQVDLSRFAGQVIDLSFAINRAEAEAYYSLWVIDDITFESSFIPDPTATPIRDPNKCSPAYPTVCIPPPPPDLDCGDIPYTNFEVLPPSDPHHLTRIAMGLDAKHPNLTRERALTSCQGAALSLPQIPKRPDIWLVILGR